MSDVLDMDATGQAEAVRAGDLSASELLEAALERVERLNPVLNAVVHEWFDQARDSARSKAFAEGPFSGVPMLLKDSLCHTAGDPHTEGMAGLKRIGWREPADCDLARAFKEAGFLIVGKTNTPEFAALPTTEPLAYGPTRNPWDTERSVGGSSGGSAAAVASRMVAVAHGTDASGSIRLPASMCGVVGLKPSRGRTPLAPDWAEWMGPVAGRYVQHVLCRSVRDTAAVLDAIALPGPGRPGDYFTRVAATEPPALRIALFDDLQSMGVAVDDECRSAAEGVARVLEELGHHVERARPSSFDFVPPLEDPASVGPAMAAFFSWFVDRLERRTGATFTEEDLEPYTWSLVQQGRQGTATGVYRVMEWMNESAQETLRWWRDGGYDLVLSPTVPEPPPLLGGCDYSTADPTRPAMRTAALCGFSYWSNWSGDPAISLPLGWSGSGLPLGVQLAAPVGREDLLLAVSHHLEDAVGWEDRQPPTAA